MCILKGPMPHSTTILAMMPASRSSVMNPIRRPICLLLMGWALLASASPSLAQVAIPQPPPIDAKSYILVDFHSGQVIAEKDSHDRVEPASITKLMTSYVAFHELKRGNVSLNDEVLISERAWRTGGSRMFVEVNTRVNLEALLKGIIIQSGNDASVAVAEHIAGTEEAFAILMNEYAKALGMSDTFYVNATGLPDPAQLTSARDSATLAKAIISEFPEFYDWYSQREFTYADIRQHNRNRLLWRDPSVDGLKTGHTEAAGYCLVTSASRNDMRLISVVMGSSGEESRATSSQSLLNYGFRFFETYALYEREQTVASAQVWQGVVDEVEVTIDEAIFVTVPRGRFDDIENELALEGDLVAPIEAGQTVGALTVRLDDEILAERSVKTQSSVEAAGFFGRAQDRFKLWWDGMFNDG